MLFMDIWPLLITHCAQLTLSFYFTHVPALSCSNVLLFFVLKSNRHHLIVPCLKYSRFFFLTCTAATLQHSDAVWFRSFWPGRSRKQHYLLPNRSSLLFAAVSCRERFACLHDQWPLTPYSDRLRAAGWAHAGVEFGNILWQLVSKSHRS